MRSNRVEPTFAQVAQLGERQTEDLNVPGSSPGLGIYFTVIVVLLEKKSWHLELKISNPTVYIYNIK